MAAGSELDPHVHVPVAAPVHKKEGFSLANHFVPGLGGGRSEGGLRHWAGC